MLLLVMGKHISQIGYMHLDHIPGNLGLSEFGIHEKKHHILSTLILEEKKRVEKCLEHFWEAKAEMAKIAMSPAGKMKGFETFL